VFTPGGRITVAPGGGGGGGGGDSSPGPGTFVSGTQLHTGGIKVQSTWSPGSHWPGVGLGVVLSNGHWAGGGESSSAAAGGAPQASAMPKPIAAVIDEMRAAVARFKRLGVVMLVPCSGARWHPTAATVDLWDR